MRKNIILILGIVIVALWVITACEYVNTPNPDVIIRTVIITVENPPIIKEVTATSEPLPEIQRTLILCIGEEPTTLFPYGYDSLASRQVSELIWDGTFDSRTYDYQPVILEKIPSLDDGDAVVQKASVNAGDPVVNEQGEVVELGPGVFIKPSGCLDPTCAVEYVGQEIVMDQLAVKFLLIKGLTWSDGTPLTAFDSVYAFHLASDALIPGTKYIENRTASYEALDDRTLLWTGLPGFLDSSYFTNIWNPLPEHIWKAFNTKELLASEDVNHLPMGWGPYILDEWIPGSHLSGHRNPHYFRAGEGLPKFDNVVVRFVDKDANTNIASVLSGECDVVDQSALLNIDESQQELLIKLEESGQIGLHYVAGMSFEHVDFGIHPASYDNGVNPAVDRPDFFSDVRTRRAFAMCMDRQTIIDQVFFGKTTVQDSYLPQEHPLFNPEIQRYPYDNEKGSKLLEDVGWILGDDGIRVSKGVSGVPDGTRFEIQYFVTDYETSQQTAQMVVNYLTDCGIQADMQIWTIPELYSDGPESPVFGRNFDLVQFPWQFGVEPPCDLWISDGVPGEAHLLVQDVPWLVEGEFGRKPDALAFPYGWGGWNNTGWNNPDFDTACKTAMQSLPKQSGYGEAHKEAQLIFTEQLPVIPLYQLIKLAISRPDFCDFELDATAKSEFWNVEEFDFGEGCLD